MGIIACRYAGIGLISETNRDSQEVLWVRVTIEFFSCYMSYIIIKPAF